MPPPPTTGSPPRPARLLGWLGLLYFASGLPNGLATDTAPTLYALRDVPAEELGLLALIELPWILKFLWAPAVDRFGERRAWFAGCQAALAAALVAFAFLPGGSVPIHAWVLLYAVAALSATQDLAVDAYSIEAVPRGFEGPANSVRVTAYRLAGLAAGSLLVGASGWLGWRGVWLAASGMFLVLAVLSAAAPRVARAPVAARPGVASFASLFRRPGFLALVAFVLLYKIGDYAMARMAKPALKRAGFTAEDLGWVGAIQVVALIAGATVGGLLTRRWGWLKALVVLGLFQAVSNLGYAVGADRGKGVLWVAAAIEPFCGGLGTAAFLSFLMLCCERAHAATQFALLTAVMAVGRLAAGSVSGFGVGKMGYANWFALTFVLALPAFLFLPAARRALASRDRPY